MLCDHQLLTEHLVDYIDDKLSPAVRRQIESVIDQCSSCQSTYHQAIAMHQAAHTWKKQPVPEWHRTEYAVRPQPKTTGWLSWTALATSTMAILMVLFQVQISTNEQGLNIAFGTSTNAQVQTLVKEELRQYKQQQQLLLDARFVAESTKQATARKLLMADFMEKARDERRDDLNFIITGIQSQRFEDQQKVEKRFSFLADNQIENSQYINQLIQSANLSEGDK